MGKQKKAAITITIAAIFVVAVQLFGPTAINCSANEEDQSNNIDIINNQIVNIPGPSGTNILFEDYFKEDKSYWETYSDSRYCRRNIDDGKLKFKKISDERDEMYDSALKRFIPPLNFIVEFDAKMENHPDEKYTRIGIILRRIDESNYYRFLISRDGKYNFEKTVDDEWSTIIPWTFSSSINGGLETNTIKVKCEEDTFTFYINNEEIDYCMDSTFASGGIALTAGAGDSSQEYLRFSFDNLKIKQISAP
jgi:hypothetical protein